ncbi:unnamed protein product [Pleuronectes platessa]|uniref:Uncharacterized protein n=1 Tax=Pleuronectes platessa TaxID=8262 RepID=A0A9N7TRT6_PLEPL|nr:unnamed protein product [Pleuronectes platessa]
MCQCAVFRTQEKIKGLSDLLLMVVHIVSITTCLKMFCPRGRGRDKTDLNWPVTWCPVLVLVHRVTWCPVLVLVHRVTWCPVLVLVHQVTWCDHDDELEPGVDTRPPSSSELSFTTSRDSNPSLQLSEPLSHHAAGPHACDLNTHEV